MSRTEATTAPTGAAAGTTLADVASNSTTTPEQTFKLDVGTSVIFEDSSGTDIIEIEESTRDVGVGISPTERLHVADAGITRILLDNTSDRQGASCL